MKLSTLICSIAGILVIGLSLAGLRNRPGVKISSQPELFDSVSSANIINHIIALSGQQTREFSSQGALFAENYIAGYMRSVGWNVEEEQFDIATSAGGATVTNIEADYSNDLGADSVLILCTHYDSRADDPGGHAPGADDNASGTAVLLEIARVLAAAGAPNAPFRVKMLFFGGEEDSMLGSIRFVSRLASERRDVIGAINVDMIGYDREGPKDFVIFTNETSSSLARCIETCAGLVPQLRYETTITDFANSDHSPFWSNGFKAVSIWEGYDHNPYYHSSLDTCEKLSPTFMTGIARVLLCAILHLAPASTAPSPH
jgi:Zn-dependent M28 family amino/carboxypeptidase